MAPVAGAHPLRRAFRSVPCVGRRAVVVAERAAVRLSTDLADRLLRAGGRAAGVVFSCVGLVAAGAFHPVLRFIVLPHGIVVSQPVRGLYVFLRLRGERRVGKAGRIGGQLVEDAGFFLRHGHGRPDGLRLLVAPVAGAHPLRRAVHSRPCVGRRAVVVAERAAVGLIAGLADRLLRAGGRAAGVGGCVSMDATAGIFFPVAAAV